MRRLLVLLILGQVVATAAQAQLKLRIDTDATEYVVRQPWSLTFVLQNSGTSPVNVAPATRLGQNMEFMVLEVTTPGGRTEKRELRFICVIRESNPYWGGELLPVGAQIVRTLYPFRTTALSLDRGHDWTLREPGIYRLRLIYSPPRNLVVLHQASGGDVVSNEISVKVTKPDAAGDEILDVYWGPEWDVLIWGDRTWRFDTDPEPLRAMAESYPDHELTRYLKLNLARALLTQSIAGISATGADEAQNILRDLRDGFPERRLEIMFHMASVYAHKQQFDKVADLFVAELRRDPDVIDDVDFVGKWILATDKGHDALEQYKSARLTGEKRKIDALGIERVKALVPNMEGTE